MKPLFLLFILLFLFSCNEDAKIKVQNNLHNVKLENISFGDVSIYASLLPGETSSEIAVIDKKNKFPKTNQLEFYMESSGNKVYLKTKNSYSLSAGETLLIIISDTTKVINPSIK